MKETEEKCACHNRPIVPGYGPDTADVVIVGEAPGEDEYREGVPFVGRSGELLDEILEQEGIAPDDVYITNVLLCYEQGNPTPKTSEIRANRGRLISEVKARNPNRVIALGAVAAKALLDTKEGIKKIRLGGPQYVEELGATVVPTFHPAAALRDPDKAPSIVSDINRGFRVKVGWEPTKYEVATLDNYGQMFDQQVAAGRLAVDLEIAAPFDRHNPEILCMAISDEPGSAIVYPREVIPRLLPAIEEAADMDISWTYHNGKYDTQFYPGVVEDDTMLLHYIGDERKGTHDLEQVSYEFLGAPAYKTAFNKEIGDEWTVENYEAHREIFHRYNATDADNAHRLYYPLAERAYNDGVLSPYEELLIPGANALAKVEWVGVRIDLEHLAKIESALERETARLERRLKRWVENPRSPKQITATLEEMGYNVPNTQKATLQDIDEPFTITLLKYKKAHKMFSTYVKGLRNHAMNGRIHSNFNLHVAESGRLSSSEPNLQNVPIDHPIREVFVADEEDHVLLEMDYEQIELRVAAALSGDPWLLETFRSGRNIHKEVATSLFGDRYDVKEYVRAKMVSFSTLYDFPESAAFNLSKRLDIPMWEAHQMVDGFFDRSPVLLDYREELERDMLDNGFLVSHFGRKRRFRFMDQVASNHMIKEAYNFPIQSAASDITLTALINLVDKGIVPRITIHDSLVFSVPKADAEDAEHEIREVMEAANPFDVPIPVDAKKSYRWQMKE